MILCGLLTQKAIIRETSEKIRDYMRCSNPEGYNSAFEHHQPITPKNLCDALCAAKPCQLRVVSFL